MSEAVPDSSMGKVIQVGGWVYIQSFFRRICTLSVGIAEMTRRGALYVETSHVDLGEVHYAAFRVSGKSYAISQLEGVDYVEMWLERPGEVDLGELYGILDILGCDRQSLGYLVDLDGGWHQL